MTRALVLALLLAACAPSAVTPPPGASASAPTATATSTPVAAASPSTTPALTPQPSPTATSTPGLMPIVDAHMHYSAEAWSEYSAGRVWALMDGAGVRSAFVSSAPDYATLDLRIALGAARIIPVLGPYRGQTDVISWTRDPTLLPYLDSHYQPGIHKGFGEFHLRPGEVALPLVQAVLRFARSRNLFLHAHAEVVALEQLLNDPIVGADYNVLWAHAGVTATPAQIDAVLAKWPKLWVELSLRDDVAPRGSLDPTWLALLRKYPDRFMVGVDTWTVGAGATGNERWDRYAEIVRGIRAWLSQLPPDLAERVAHSNAERFIGIFK